MIVRSQSNSRSFLTELNRDIRPDYSLLSILMIGCMHVLYRDPINNDLIFGMIPAYLYPASGHGKKNRSINGIFDIDRLIGIY